MTNDYLIYNFNNTHSFLYKIIKEYHNLSNKDLHTDLQKTIHSFFKIVNNKKLNYSDFKKALLPADTKKHFEFSYFFNSSLIDDTFYSGVIYNILLTQFKNEGVFAVQAGDIINYNHNIDYEKIILDSLNREVIFSNVPNKIHSSEIYVLHLNSITLNRHNSLIEKFSQETYFIGYANFSYPTLLKYIISNSIGTRFLKIKDKIIATHGADKYDCNENINLSLIDFEKYGYNYYSFQDIYFDHFLTFKMEGIIPKNINSDRDLSYNLLNNEIPTELEFELEDKKFDYLLKEKIGSLKSLANGMMINKENIYNIILEKLSNNFIYNLEKKTYNKKTNRFVIKFNIFIDTLTIENQAKKITVSFELNPKENKFRLITLY